MKTWYIKRVTELSRMWAAYWLLLDWEVVTSHYCSHDWYADMDLLRHEEAKDFDIIYWINWNIVYMNGEISEEARQSFNEAEESRWMNKYWIQAPSNHLI